MTLKGSWRLNRNANEAESNPEYTPCFRSDFPNFLPHAIALPASGRGEALRDHLLSS
jgi:hypothetical protein